MTQFEFPDNPEQFAKMLENAGMPTKRAQVCAHREYGMTNKETAESVGSDFSTVYRHYELAKEDLSNASKLDSYLNGPTYAKMLPEGMGEYIMDTTNKQDQLQPDFRLNRPKYIRGAGVDDPKYTLHESSTIEGYHVRGDSYLLAHWTPEEESPASVLYYTVSVANLVQLIHDWIIPNRGTFTTYTAPGPNEWILTDVSSPEWLEEELAENGIERVEAFTDSRFQNPIENSSVEVSNDGGTGVHRGQYRVIYSPTVREVAKFLERGRIEEEDVEKMTGR